MVVNARKILISCKGAQQIQMLVKYITDCTLVVLRVLVDNQICAFRHAQRKDIEGKTGCIR